MACVHLRRLYQLCQDENLRLSGSDLIHIVCQQCGVQEVCPSAFVEEFEVDGEASPTKPGQQAVRAGELPPQSTTRDAPSS